MLNTLRDQHLGLLHGAVHQREDWVACPLGNGVILRTWLEHMDTLSPSTT